MTVTVDLPGRFDPDRLQRLLALVGPDMAPRLLDQLALDLQACETAIGTGIAVQDWKALREASHVLISLAGSVGADGLHDLARRLNDAAHAQSTTLLAPLQDAILADLTALIAHVRRTLPKEPPQ